MLRLPSKLARQCAQFLDLWSLGGPPCAKFVPAFGQVRSNASDDQCFARVHGRCGEHDSQPRKELTSNVKHSPHWKGLYFIFNCGRL